jgi:small conductance mechanosensitive channel
MEKIASLFHAFISLPLVKNQGETLMLMAVLFFAGRIFIRFVARYIKKIADDGNDEILSGREKRAATIAGMFKTAGNVGLFLVLLGMGLSLVGVNAATILGAAGIVSFAVGFGTQSLVKDLVAGMFIFAENQFAIGDKVKVNDKEGIVRRMSIRTTVLELDAKTDPATGVVTPGCFIFIANGGITSVCNYSLKPPPAAAVPAPVAYEWQDALEPTTLVPPPAATLQPAK